MQVVWSIVVLRPKGVSSGCTERQPLTSPQCPQPSQMRGLMATRRPGVGARTYRLRMPPFDRLAPGELQALVGYLAALRERDEDGTVIEPPEA